MRDKVIAALVLGFLAGWGAALVFAGRQPKTEQPCDFVKPAALHDAIASCLRRGGTTTTKQHSEQCFTMECDGLL